MFSRKPSGEMFSRKPSGGAAKKYCFTEIALSAPPKGAWHIGLWIFNFAGGFNTETASCRRACADHFSIFQLQP